MNKFDQKFFAKYIPEWQKLKGIVHEHFIVIVWQLFKWILIWVLIPSFLLYYFTSLITIIPFVFFEAWLLIVYLKLMYDIFNRYNDVWIITTHWVIDLDWELFWADTVSVKFTSIEWVEVEQDWIIDTILWKWNLIIHKIWSDNFMLSSANKPYDAVNEIEQLSQKYWEPEYDNEGSNNSENFDVVMEALSWVVWEYLEKKWLKEKVDEEKEYLIEEYREKKWTIDLS